MTASLTTSRPPRPGQFFHKNKGTDSQSLFHHIDESAMSRSAPKQKISVTNRIFLLGAILTLGNLANIIHKSSRVYLYQQAECFLYYRKMDPTKIQPDFRIDEALCKIRPIQSRLSAIEGIDSFLNYLPRESHLALVIYAMSVIPSESSPGCLFGY